MKSKLILRIAAILVVLVGILGQALADKICPKCHRRYQQTALICADDATELQALPRAPKPAPASFKAGPKLRKPPTPPATRPKKDLVVNRIDGAEMIRIPAGTFLMGEKDNPEIRDNLRHKVYLSEYWIYKKPVTVAQYRKFCKATGHEMPEPPEWGWADNEPIVNTSWDDASAYCKWAGVQLPTEAQWEKAARGTDGRKFPWGNDWNESCCRCTTADDSPNGPAPVGHYTWSASPYGALDMAGNVWQWCSDWYSPDYCQTDDERDPPGPKTGTARVMRGGAWNLSESIAFRSAFRKWAAPDYASNEGICGFRCAAKRPPR